MVENALSEVFLNGTVGSSRAKGGSVECGLSELVNVS
jgi:hypothetical protein